VTFVTQPILDRRSALARRPDAELARPADLDPDGELVVRWRAGDARAFEILVQRHERRVLGLLMRMLGNREDAQDAAQETFLNLHRHGHRFRRESRFSTFVYRVAVNAALNRRRTLGRRRAHLERLSAHQAAGHDVPSAPRGPEDATAGEQVRDRVSQGILALNPALRAPLVLYDIEGLPYGEIARVLGLAEGTVKSRIHRARRALRDQLRDLVGDEAAAPEVPE
jgi:RNA polymerase sigma-70 factor, ECF subfamily